MLINLATRMAYVTSSYPFDDPSKTAATLVEQQALATSRLQLPDLPTPPKASEVSAKYQHIVTILTAKEPTLDAHG